MAVPCVKNHYGKLVLMNLCRPVLGVQFFETQCSYRNSHVMTMLAIPTTWHHTAVTIDTVDKWHHCSPCIVLCRQWSSNTRLQLVDFVRPHNADSTPSHWGSAGWQSRPQRRNHSVESLATSAPTRHCMTIWHTITCSQATTIQCLRTVDCRYL